MGAFLAAGAVGVLSASPASTPRPLPNDCQGISGEGQPPPVCCVFGYVYFAGAPVDGAQVVIQSAGAVLTTTTSSGTTSLDPHCANALSDPPLNVVLGETITVTATYSGATTSTVHQVAGKGQQVDVVIPIAGGDQPPIGTINYVHPNVAKQRTDTVVFAGSGADGDDAGAGVVAWEWTSDLAGVLSTQEDFRVEAYSLVTGTHTISLRVQDDEGNWSVPLARTLLVKPMTFELRGGWQVILFPALPTANYYAQTLLADITAQGGCPTEIVRWLPDIGNWGSYRPGLPFGNFAVLPGQPHFLRASCPNVLRLPAGYSVTPGGTITLTTGWNFVALPRAVGAMPAETACQQIAAQGGAVSEIDLWDPVAGNWAGHICGLPFADFEMVPDDGYFIKSQADSVWRPSGSTSEEAEVLAGSPEPASTLGVTRSAVSLQNVRSSNAGDRSFTLSWLTDSPTTTGAPGPSGRATT